MSIMSAEWISEMFCRSRLSALIFLALLVLSSTPHSSSLAAEETKPEFHVYRGVSHIHSHFSHDSKAALSLVYKKARERELDFAIITDHNSLKGREAYKETHYKTPPLLFFGNEISTPDGHLLALGIKSDPPGKIGSQELIHWIHSEGGYAFLPHPFSQKHPWKNWDVDGWDGFELYNFGHELFEADAVDLYIRSFGESNESLLPETQIIPAENFAFWDKLTGTRKVAAIGGADAHLKKKERWFAAAMESVTLYVKASGLEENAIIDAMAKGRTFIVFETNGLAKDFDFWADTKNGRYTMGDEITSEAGTVLHVHLPESAKIVLIRNGAAAAEEETQDFTFAAGEPGVYRVDVYRNGRLWLVSNPIYIRKDAKQ